MSFDFPSLFNMALAGGPAIVAVFLAVLVLVYIADFTTLLPNGTAKRIAVFVLSFLFAGAQSGQVESALVGAISAVAASLAKVLIDALVAYLTSLKAANAPKA